MSAEKFKAQLAEMTALCADAEFPSEIESSRNRTIYFDDGVESVVCSAYNWNAASLTIANRQGFIPALCISLHHEGNRLNLDPSLFLSVTAQDYNDIGAVLSTNYDLEALGTRLEQTSEPDILELGRILRTIADIEPISRSTFMTGPQGYAYPHDLPVVEAFDLNIRDQTTLPTKTTTHYPDIWLWGVTDASQFVVQVEQRTVTTTDDAYDQLYVTAEMPAARYILSIDGVDQKVEVRKSNADRPTAILRYNPQEGVAIMSDLLDHVIDISLDPPDLFMQ